MTKEPQDSNNAEDSPPESTAPVVTGPTLSAASGGGTHAQSAPGRRSRLALLGLVLAVVALALAAWSGIELLRQNRQLATASADTAAALQRVDAQDQQLRELQRQFDQRHDATLQHRQAVDAQFETLQKALASQRKQLDAMSTTDRADWLLAEAEYLIRLANQRLLMGRELAGARELLKAADNIMVELDDSRLFPVRSALADDMAELRAAGKLDVEGTYLKLAAAARQAAQLRLFEMPQFRATSDGEAAPTGWRETLQSGFAAALDKLKGYIRFTSREQAFQPTLAPDQEAAVRQSLQLMFEQAQLAALAGKQSLYEMSLQKAAQWLDRYYNLDRDATQALLATLSELEQQQVQVQLPDISDSLRALNEYQDARHDTVPVAPKADTSGEAPVPETAPALTPDAETSP